MLRRIRSRVHLVAAAALVAVALPAGGLVGRGAAAAPAVQVDAVSYRVTLSQDGLLPGSAYTVRGLQYSGTERSSTVVLLLHGLSYGKWAWDFPIASDGTNPYAYSMARFLASHGYDAVAVDELGYGSSDHPPFPDSRQLTVFGYANMAHQIVQSLHTTYARVIIAGHSAGGEIANIEAGRYRDVDGLVDMSMCDVLASPEVIADIAISDSLGALGDYGYFGLTVPERTRLMYFLPDADPAIVALDTKMAELTPTSEMQSIAPQPGKAFDALVTAPVLIAFSDNDAIFPPMCQQFQPLLYPLSRSLDVFHLPSAGHSFMLHRNAPDAEAALLHWLQKVVPL